MPGIISSYVHTENRIGVLVEVSCQTDVTALTTELKTLAKNVALQVAACLEVEYVKVSDIPVHLVENEKLVELNREDLRDKPNKIRDRIAQERAEERLQARCLLNQPYIKDQTITVEDLVKQHSVQLGEHVQIRRFVRYVVDEMGAPPSPPPDAGSGTPRKPLPNSPEPLASEQIFE
jgi:elongation factor Ts